MSSRRTLAVCTTLLPLLEQTDRQGRYDAPTLQLMKMACECLETEPVPFDPVLDLIERR